MKRQCLTFTPFRTTANQQRFITIHFTATCNQTVGILSNRADFRARFSTTFLPTIEKANYARARTSRLKSRVAPTKVFRKLRVSLKHHHRVRRWGVLHQTLLIEATYRFLHALWIRLPIVSRHMKQKWDRGVNPILITMISKSSNSICDIFSIY